MFTFRTSDSELQVCTALTEGCTIAHHEGCSMWIVPMFCFLRPDVLEWGNIIHSGIIRHRSPVIRQRHDYSFFVCKLPKNKLVALIGQTKISPWGRIKTFPPSKYRQDCLERKRRKREREVDHLMHLSKSLFFLTIKPTSQVFPPKWITVWKCCFSIKIILTHIHTHILYYARIYIYYKFNWYEHKSVLIFVCLRWLAKIILAPQISFKKKKKGKTRAQMLNSLPESLTVFFT